jgi:putative transposase
LEAHFKTLKYRPEFPARFGCLEDARAHCQGFFAWYNDTHRHSGIGYMTPAAVHYGRAQGLFKLPAHTLDAAFMVNPKRFKGNCPQPPKQPVAAWINPPKIEPAISKTSQQHSLN